MSHSDHPAAGDTVDLSYSGGLTDEFRAELRAALEREGFAIGEETDYLAEAVGLPPDQVWLTFVEGAAFTAGALAVTGVAATGRSSIRRLSRALQLIIRRHRAAFNIDARNARGQELRYVVPPGDEGVAALAEMEADYTHEPPPYGERWWIETRRCWGSDHELWRAQREARC